jgi:hypothetical protein
MPASNLFAFSLSVILAGAVSGAVLDRVAVVVGHDVITEGEVIDELRLSEFMQLRPLDLGPQQRREAAARLVDQQLIRHEMEVDRFHPPAASEAESMLRNFRQEHFRGDSDYRAALQRYGIIDDQFKQYLLWQLTAIRFTDDRFHPKIPGNPEPSANRQAGSAPPAPDSSVDDQLDAWLKQARAATRIVYQKEAFE